MIPRTMEGLWGQVTLCGGHPCPSSLPRVNAHASRPVACKPEKRCPRLSSEALANEKVYFKQYYTTSPSRLLEGVGGDRHAPGALPGTGRGPRPGCPWPRAGAKVVTAMTPCTRPSSPRSCSSPPGSLPLPGELAELGPQFTSLRDQPPPSTPANPWLHGQALPHGRPASQSLSEGPAASGSLMGRLYLVSSGPLGGPGIVRNELVTASCIGYGSKKSKYHFWLH